MAAPSQSKIAPSTIASSRRVAGYLTTAVTSRSLTAPSRQYRQSRWWCNLNLGFCYQQRYYPYRYNCYSATLTLSRSLIAGNQAAVAPKSKIIASSPRITSTCLGLMAMRVSTALHQDRPISCPSVSLAQSWVPCKTTVVRPRRTRWSLAVQRSMRAILSGCRDSLGAILTIDQRGFARQFDGDHNGTSRCDIGAYELGSILVASSETFVRQQYLDFSGSRPGIRRPFRLGECPRRRIAESELD